ncbi:MAG: hypothetical protein ACMXYA_01175 [Candidatus Woesearchaeota archaeon]
MLFGIHTNKNTHSVRTILEKYSQSPSKIIDYSVKKNEFLLSHKTNQVDKKDDYIEYIYTFYVRRYKLGHIDIIYYPHTHSFLLRYFYPLKFVKDLKKSPYLIGSRCFLKACEHFYRDCKDNPQIQFVAHSTDLTKFLEKLRIFPNQNLQKIIGNVFSYIKKKEKDIKLI